MSIGFHPFILIAAGGVLFALLACLLVCLTRNRRVKILMFALAMLFLLPSGYLVMSLHPELTDARFRAYKAFYQDIHVGMTRADVLAALNRHYPATGKRQRPEMTSDQPGQLGFFMNPEGSQEPNCEGILLKLEADRVASKEYLPD